MGHPLEPGWTQLGRHSFLSHTANPFTCSASLLTACGDSSLRVHSCPPHWRVPPSSVRLQPFSSSSRQMTKHEINDIYVGLMVHHVKSCLCALDKILDFVADIEVDLKVARDTLKAGGDPGKRHAFCLFVSNYGGAMSIPTDPPYCLIYPTSYVRDVELDHF